MDKQQLLKKLEKEWTAFNASYAGLSVYGLISTLAYGRQLAAMALSET
ncbi:hypothetical protein KSD_73900 [Ktedonobacter sp. SOSP1-85]|nr:hypothetical protein [Ktedonobacter sp. SOSP1-85]GHO79619.1 hypothetical protein KSD_73900 [Ktedonobacter sp. SOSP1-85]